MNAVDLNRNWNDVAKNDWDRELPEPEVSSVKRFFGNWMAETGRMDFFFDCHCLTALSGGLLMISEGGDNVPAEIDAEQEKFTDLFSKRWKFRRSKGNGMSGSAGNWVAGSYAREFGVKTFTPEHCIGRISRADGEPMKAKPALWREIGADYIWVLREYFEGQK